MIARTLNGSGRTGDRCGLALALVLVASVTGCASVPRSDDAIARDQARLVAEDFVSALLQLRGFSPRNTTLQVRPAPSAFGAEVLDELRRKGFGIQTVGKDDDGPLLLSYDAEAFGDSIGYRMRVGAVELGREYEIRGGRVFPATAMSVTGQRISEAPLDDTMFDRNVRAEKSEAQTAWLPALLDEPSSLPSTTGGRRGPGSTPAAPANDGLADDAEGGSVANPEASIVQTLPDDERAYGAWQVVPEPSVSRMIPAAPPGPGASDLEPERETAAPSERPKDWLAQALKEHLVKRAERADPPAPELRRRKPLPLGDDVLLESGLLKGDVRRHNYYRLLAAGETFPAVRDGYAVVTRGVVNFAPNSSDLSGRGKQLLSEMVDAFDETRDLFTVIGVSHASAPSLGPQPLGDDAAYRNEWAFARADRVHAELNALGVPVGHTLFKGSWGDRPLPDIVDRTAIITLYRRSPT